jgi:hypothetical protein
MFSIKKITLIVLLIATCNLVWQFYRIGRDNRDRQIAYEQHGVIVCRLGPSRDEISRIFIEFCLLVALVGSRLRGIKNSALSLLGLSGGVILYVLWWRYLFEIVSDAGADKGSIPHLAYLYGGNLLDLAIAGLIGLLVLVNLWCVAHSGFRPTTPCS